MSNFSAFPLPAAWLRIPRTWQIPFLAGACLLLAACASPSRPPVEDLAGKRDLSSLILQTIKGTRDGARLDVEAIFRSPDTGPGSEAGVLTVSMRFAVGSPTTLHSGQWQWPQAGHLAGGPVRERSVMFLGGQSGPPSVGGRFDLVNADGKALYRINIPTTVLKNKLLDAEEWMRR